MKKITRETDILSNAWSDMYNLYKNNYLPENNDDWEVFFKSASDICNRYQNNTLVCGIISVILSYAEERKKKESE